MDKLNYKIAEQTLKLLNTYDWQYISLDIVCKKLKINKKKVINNFKNKNDLLKNINEYFDNQIFLNTKSIDLSTPKDMIFEIFMLRFDLLNRYRFSVKKIFNIFICYPKIFIFLLPSFINSMNNMAEYAKIKTKGIIGSMKIKGLLIIYFSTFLTWIKDEGSSLDKTMTVLDGYLNRADSLFKLIDK